MCQYDIDKAINFTFTGEVLNILLDRHTGENMLFSPNDKIGGTLLHVTRYNDYQINRNTGLSVVENGASAVRQALSFNGDFTAHEPFTPVTHGAIYSKQGRLSVERDGTPTAGYKINPIT